MSFILNIIYMLLEYKEAILLLIAVIGFYFTIRNFASNVRQKKLENTFRILDFLRTHISSGQIDMFIELFHANNPLGGGSPQEFYLKDGRIDTVDTMFSEGGCGNGDIHNIIEIFNLISINLNKGELVDDLIWYEYGQIMSKCFEWTNYLEVSGPDRRYYKDVLKRSKKLSIWERYKIRRFLCPYYNSKLKFYYHFNKYMRKKQKAKLIKAVKYYTYIE